MVISQSIRPSSTRPVRYQLNLKARDSQKKMFRNPRIGDRFPKPPPSKHQMTFFGRRWRFSLAALICVLATPGLSFFLQGSHAQASKLVLISQDTSTRGIALDSVTLKREPFNSASEVSWGNDTQTRVMLFAMGLDPKTSANSITANAEDGAHKTYPLTVEYVGP